MFSLGGGSLQCVCSGFPPVDCDWHSHIEHILNLFWFTVAPSLHLCSVFNILCVWDPVLCAVASRPANGPGVEWCNAPSPLQHASPHDGFIFTSDPGQACITHNTSLGQATEPLSSTGDNQLDQAQTSGLLLHNNSPVPLSLGGWWLIYSLNTVV